jgi:acyl CoA:acetate/3-ketoacid CoA transferase beta subunit
MSVQQMTRGRRYYTVLRADQSCTAGCTWDLPRPDGTPGEWQTLPTHTQPRPCENGGHLTEDPAARYEPGCTVYLAEFAAERCRLLRALSPEELADLGIYTEGVHTCQRAGRRSIACGSARVTATGSARVTAHDSARVIAHDSARVIAHGSAQVTAYGSAQVTATDSAQVKATGSAQVIATGSAQVKATDSAQVKVTGSAQVTAYGSAQVTAYGSAQVTASGSAQVTASGSAQVTASGSAQVTASGSAQVTASGSAVVTAHESARVRAESYSTVIRRSLIAQVSLVGCAVEVDWTGRRAGFRRATPAPRGRRKVAAEG